MTELERQLMDALTGLAEQYERDQERAGRASRSLATANRDTDEGFDRVDELINSGRGSAHRGGRAVGKASRVLGGAIHRAGRSVAEAVSRLSQFVQDVIRRREEKNRKRVKLSERSSGWDRDDGPSR